MFLNQENVPEKIIEALIKRNNKPLETGELVLLARAIADKITLENISTKDLILSYKYSIENICCFLNNFTYINENESKLLYEIIEGLVAWRQSVAFNPKPILFISNDNYLIDEMSLITQFVDSSLLCSVGYIYNNAQYTYDLFKSLVESLSVRKNQDGSD